MFKAFIPKTHNFEIVSDAHEHTISIVIAHDETKGRVTFVKCVFAHTAVITDFSFSIAVAILDGTEQPFETFDRNEAYHFIPDSVRRRVMGLVVQALKELVQKVNPEAIYRVTKERNPVEKSYIKHNLLTDALEECGYTLEETGKDHHDRPYWVMSK